MDYKFIGVVKFFDSRVNHFGYLTVFNPSRDINNDSVRVEEEGLSNDPSKYTDGSIVLFNKMKSINNARDVVLLYNASKDDVKNTIESIKFDELQQYCELAKVDFTSSVEKIIKILLSIGLSDDAKKYYHLLEENLSVDKNLIFFSKYDSKYFQKLISGDPKYIEEISDSNKLKVIIEGKDIKLDLLINFANHWKFDDNYSTRKILSLLNRNNIEKTSVKTFINNIEKNFKTFELDMKVEFLDFIQDPKLCIELLPSLLSEVNNNKINVPIQKIFRCIENNSRSIMSDDNVKLKLAKIILQLFDQSGNNILRDYYQNISANWLISDDEISNRWELDNFNDLDELLDFLKCRSVKIQSEKLIEKYWHFINDNLNNIEVINKSIEIGELLNDILRPIDILLKYTINKENYQKAMIGQRFIPTNNETLVEYLEDFEEIAPDEEFKSTVIVGLINYWRTLLGIGDNLPPKEIMSSWFELKHIPDPLQLIFLKAIVKNIHLGIYSRHEAANYLNKFVFTDLSSLLLMILIRNRNKAGLSDIAPLLNQAFIQTLESTDQIPYIGYTVKHCDGRKYWSGNINYDKSKKTYSFDGGFGKEINLDESPAKYSLPNENSLSYITGQDSYDDLPF